MLNARFFTLVKRAISSFSTLLTQPTRMTFLVDKQLPLYSLAFKSVKHLEVIFKVFLFLDVTKSEFKYQKSEFK